MNSLKALRKTQKLVLNNNHIRTLNDNIDPKLFYQMKRLEELHLDSAFDERQVATGAPFLTSLRQLLSQSNLVSLKMISLKRNGLQSIDSDFFCSTPDLQELYLNGNRLSEFSLNTSCLHYLNWLDVSHNQISKIDNSSIAFIRTGPSKYHLNLTENPFKCDCSLLDFYRFVKNVTDATSSQWPNIKLDQVESLRCYPPSNTGRSIGIYFDDLSEEDLDCHRNGGIILDSLTGAELRSTDENIIKHESEALQRYRRYVALSYLVLTMLVIILISLLGGLVWTNKHFFIVTYNSLRMEFGSKKEYTALDKDSASASRQTEHIRIVDPNTDEHQL